MPQPEEHSPKRLGLKGFIARRPHLIPAAVAAVMLCLAMGKWPYDYYRIMRWVVCAAAVFVAYQSWTWRKPWGMWVFGFAALLFNPLVPAHLNRATWQVLDLAMAALLVAGIGTLSKPASKTQNPADE